MSGKLLLAATIAFRGATLIDGRGTVVPDSLLVVTGGRIAYAGAATPEALAGAPADATMVAAGGRWIVPGLIDAHVHAESDADLEEMLRWGVTSVRLMAEDVAAARALAARAAAPGSGMPDVLPAAPIFTRKGGWWDQGQPADANLNRFPENPEEARAAVRRARALGSAEIKIMLDDMAWCRAPKPPLPKLAPEVARALAAEGRRQGLRVIVHAPELADALEAIEAQATALAHGVLEPIDDSTIARMRRRPVTYIPTMGVFEFLADTHGFMDGVLADPVVTTPGVGLAPERVARYRSAAYASEYQKRYPNFANVRRRLPALRENLRRLHAAGVPVALGTDMWALPGLGVSVEMDLYVRAGLTPLDAIRSATQVAAQSLGVGTVVGTLEPGKRADFLVVRADPTRDVKNVRKIQDVYKAGVRVGPAPRRSETP